MKLTLDIIGESLPETYQCRKLGSEGMHLSFGRPILLEPGDKLCPGHLYVGSSSTLQKVAPHRDAAVICAGRQLPAGWADSGGPMLLVTAGPDIPALYREIQAIYDKFDDWDAALRDELEKDDGIDLRRMLYLGAEVFENPLGVSDYGLRTILQTDFVEKPDGKIEIQVVNESRGLTTDSGELVKEVCRLERVITVPYLTAASPMEYRFYCNNLYSDAGGPFLGCIYLGERLHQFREGDFFLAAHFFARFRTAYLRHLRLYAQPEKPGVEALKKLLTGRVLTREDAAQLSLGPGEYWMCFCLREREGRKYMLRDYMCAMLNAFLPGAVYAVVENGRILGLLRLGGARHEPGSILSTLRECLRRMEYVGGLSNPFSRLEDLDAYLIQASYTARRFARSDDDALFFFRDCVLQYMLASCLEKLPLEFLYTPGFLALLAHDGKRNTDYAHTLDVYLKNDRNITKTAEMLYIHRSSLLKRLERIFQLTGDDMKAPDTRLYYRLCFSLQEADKLQKEQ